MQETDSRKVAEKSGNIQRSFMKLRIDKLVFLKDSVKQVEPFFRWLMTKGGEIKSLEELRLSVSVLFQISSEV